jgi:hypothetical protein
LGLELSYPLCLKIGSNLPLRSASKKLADALLDEA